MHERVKDAGKSEWRLVMGRIGVESSDNITLPENGADFPCRWFAERTHAGTLNWGELVMASNG
ncbi:MAG: hypothetical protein ACYC9S_14135 [Leptospirales bacterium]